MLKASNLDYSSPYTILNVIQFLQTFCFSEEPLSVQIEGMGKVGLRSINSGGMESRYSQIGEHS